MSVEWDRWAQDYHSEEELERHRTSRLGQVWSAPINEFLSERRVLIFVDAFLSRDTAILIPPGYMQRVTKNLIIHTTMWSTPSGQLNKLIYYEYAGSNLFEGRNDWTRLA